MAERPEYFPEWATQDVNLPNTGNINKQRPKETLRTIGFDKGQEISAEEFNWMFNNMGQWVEFLEQEIAEGISSTRDVNVNAGNGLTGGGSLAGDVTLSLGTPSTLTVSTTNQTTLASHTHQIDLSGRAITGANGLTGGGTLDINRTISMGTPSTITVSSTNTNAGSTHNHQIDLSGRSIAAGNGLSGGGNLSANRTISLGTPGTITASTANSVTSTSHTHNVDITGFFSGANNSLTENGYQKLPGGLIIQWGKDTQNSSSNSQYFTVNFPIPFPNACLNINLTSTTGTVSGGSSNEGAAVSDITLTRFTIYKAWNKAFLRGDRYWFAIGF